MEPNKNDDMLNQENDQNIEYNNICERCKINRVTLICEECKPFHYFCNQCDTAVHELPLRKNHHRIPIDSYQNSTIIQKSNEISTQNITLNKFFTPKHFPNNSLSLNFNNINNKNDITDINNFNDKNNALSYINKSISPKTDKGPILNHSYTYVYNRNGNAVGIGADECKKVYSKDYVNELNIMHDKEKEELLYKITTLENTMNRIKSSLNDQISKIQLSQNIKDKENNDKIEQIKMEYNLKIDNIEKEKEFKDKEILNFKQQILEQAKLNENISSSFEELKNNYNNLLNEHKLLNKEYKMLEDNSKKEYENLNQKLLETIKSYEQYKEKTNIDIQNIIDSNKKNINDLIQQKELEIKEINLNHSENIKKQLDCLTEKYEKIINDISNENNILRQDNIILVEKINNEEEKINQEKDMYNKNINLLRNEKEQKNIKINEIQKNLDEINYKNKELEKIIDDLKNQNNELKQIINEKIKEKENLQEKILVLNNEIKSAQATNDLITEKIKRLQEENRKIKVNYDAMNIESSNKLKNYKFIEERNNMLESENENLKNKIDTYIKPLSFNYLYAQK